MIIKSLLKQSNFYWQENPIINNIYEVPDGKTALEIIQKKKIDIVISDFNMPEMNGIELTQNIKLKYPQIKILIITNERSRGIIKEIIDSEAEGFLLKNTSQEELEIAINKIANGGIYYRDKEHQILREN